MSLNKDNILTIGSVVRLKSGNLVMITGFAHQRNNEYYDYVGVNFPSGLNINNKEYKFLNSEDIDKVEHHGYSTDKDKSFREKLINVLDNMVIENE